MKHHRGERRGQWACALAFLFLFLPALALAGERVRVERVLDGDTVVVRAGSRELRVRLLGVDTPELARDDRPAGPLAETARRFTRQVLARGETVELEIAGDRIDAYGRTLGFLWVRPSPEAPAVNLSEELLRAGLARAVRGFDYPGKAGFLALEREARRRGRGLWRR